MYFSSGGGLDISENLAVDFDFANSDIGMNNGVVADDQGFATIDRSVKITVDPNNTRKLKFAGEVGSLIEKRRDLLFFVSPNFHFPSPSKLGSNESFVKPVHFFKRKEMKFDFSLSARFLNRNLRT